MKFQCGSLAEVTGEKRGSPAAFTTAGDVPGGPPHEETRPKVDFFSGQDALDIRDYKKSVQPNCQIIYARLHEKVPFRKAPQFSGKNCLKIGKTMTDEGGICIRDSAFNGALSSKYTDFVCVLAPHVDETTTKRIESQARELMRNRKGFQKIPDASVIGSSGREWTAWDNKFPDETGTSEEFGRIFEEVVTKAYEKVMGIKPSIAYNKPSWVSEKTALQKEISDELANKSDDIIERRAGLISLPTGTGKEPLTLEMLLGMQKKMNKGTINVLWLCPSPLNDIIAEVMKWNEFYCGTSVYALVGDELKCVHSAAGVEVIRLVVVSLPSLKAPDRLKVTDDIDEDYDADLNEEENSDPGDALNKTINALRDFKKEHGSFDVKVQDESHEAYDTSRTDEAYNRLKAEGIVDDSVIDIRKSATDYNAFRRSLRSGSPVIHRSITDLTPQMVKEGRWPAQKLVVIATLMRRKLKEIGWSEEDIEAQMVSKNPRDWKPAVNAALIAALIYQIPSRDFALLPQHKQDALIGKLYHGDQGVFLLHFAHVADGDSLFRAVSTKNEPCGNGNVDVGLVDRQPFAFVKVYGTDRSCTPERDLNDIINRQLELGRHVFILTCGAFCQGNNIPKLDAVVLMRRLKSRKRLVQLMGRLNRSRGIQNDVKYFVVLDKEVGTNIQLEAAVEEYEDKVHSGTPTDLEPVANVAQDILPMYNFCHSGWEICEKHLSDEWTESVEQKFEAKWDNDKDKYHETLEGNTAIGAAALSKNKRQNITLPGIGSGEESDIPEYREPRPTPSPKDLAKQAEKDKKTRRARADDLVEPILECALYATRCDTEVKCKGQLIELIKDKWDEHLSWFKKNKTTMKEVLAVIHEINELWLTVQLSKIATPIEYTQALNDIFAQDHVSCNASKPVV